MLWFAFGTRIQPVGAPFRLPLWAVLLASAVVPLWTIRLEFREEAPEFSLNELVVVVGLWFATPADLMIGQIAGAMISNAGATLLDRRRPVPAKLAFEGASTALETCTGLLVLSLLMPGDDPAGAVALLTAFLVTGVASVMRGLLIHLAMIATAADLAEKRWREQLTFDLGITMTATGLGVVIVVILWFQPTAAWAVAIPAALVLVVYRSSTSDRVRSDGVRLLYGATRALQHETRPAGIAETVLTSARDIFSARLTALVLHEQGEGGPGMAANLDPAGAGFTVAPAGHAPGWARTAEAVRLTGTEAEAAGSGVRDVMLAPLRGEGGTIGAIMVADRAGHSGAFTPEELELLETLVNHASVALENARLVGSLEVSLDRLHEQATTDVLTGLANRALLMERAEAALAGARPDRAVAVLLLDLDGFKTVNDSLGHAAGDELLVAVSRRIQAVLRPGDTAARLGGDEFALLLDPAPGDEEAARVAGELLARLGEPVVIEGRRMVVNGSVGVAVGHARRAPSELLRDADAAMYAAKRAGKGRYAVFEPGMHAAALERLELEQALREALARPDGGIEVVYQPIVALHTGRPVAVEALARLPGHDHLSPARLSVLADGAGLAAALGERVLRTACRQLGRWRAELGARAPVTVNVNLPARLVLEPGLPGLVGRALEAGGLDAGHLELELTEGALLEDSPGVPSTLAALRGSGIRLAIDHFGAGSSSLSWLRRVSVDTLKIDRSLIAGLAGGGEGATLAAAVVRLGFALDLQVVATGVEDDAELEALRALRCPLGQGSRLGRPLPAAGLTRLLREGRAVGAATD